MIFEKGYYAYGKEDSSSVFEVVDTNCKGRQLVRKGLDKTEIMEDGRFKYMGKKYDLNTMLKVTDKQAEEIFTNSYSSEDALLASIKCNDKEAIKYWEKIIKEKNREW